MKFRFFIVITLALAMIALGTSCSHPSKNKIVGKWKITSWQYRDQPTSEWKDRLDGDEPIYEFRDDNTVYVYTNESPGLVVGYSYDKDNNTITITFQGTYTIQDFSSNEMTWHGGEPFENPFYGSSIIPADLSPYPDVPYLYLDEEVITLKKIR